MAVDRVPVLKRCRSLDLDPVYLGIDKKSTRKLTRANRKMSEYALQLREKQKAKFIYGVLEKPFRNYYAKASRMNGQVGANLMILLECRLDNVLFRMGFGRTRKETRQIVDHKHVLVNGKSVNIPSYLVKAGDVIEIKEKYKSSQRYKDIAEKYYYYVSPESPMYLLWQLLGRFRDYKSMADPQKCSQKEGLSCSILKNQKLKLLRFPKTKDMANLWLNRWKEAMVPH